MQIKLVQSQQSEKLQKKFDLANMARTAATAGLVSAAIAGAPSVAQAPAATHQQVHQSQVSQAQKDFGTHPEDKFLWTIEQIESSGGKNLKHHPAIHGMSTGETAIGKWGLMPKTVREMIDRKARDGKMTPADQALKRMDPKAMSAYLNDNPDSELDIARQLARHVLHRQGGNLPRSAYAWDEGHNLFPKDIPTEKLANHHYVQMFNRYHRNNPIRVQPAKKSEPGAFVVKFRAWKMRRMADEIKPQPRQTNENIDMGRTRPPELDYVAPMDSLRSRLKVCVADAKKTGSPP